MQQKELLSNAWGRRHKINPIKNIIKLQIMIKCSLAVFHVFNQRDWCICICKHGQSVLDYKAADDSKDIECLENQLVSPQLFGLIFDICFSSSFFIVENQLI